MQNWQSWYHFWPLLFGLAGILGGNCPKQGNGIFAAIALPCLRQLPCLGQLPSKILASWKRSGQKWYQSYQFCTSNVLEWILRIQICQIHWKKWPQKDLCNFERVSTLLGHRVVWKIRIIHNSISIPCFILLQSVKVLSNFNIMLQK